LVFIAIAFKDHESFFPLANHSDLRFQITGECLEFIALGILFSLTGFFWKEADRSKRLHATFRLRIVLAGFFAIFLLTEFWRDFFPNDQFNLSAGWMDFLYAPLGALGLVAVSYLLGPKREKPNKEQEKWVV
jgi:hypothetical protein